MKSKINHLIPLLSITSGIEELCKTIIKIIFNTQPDHSNLPRENDSPLTLLHHKILVRQILKLSERNLIYTNNIEEDEIIGRIG